MRHIAFIAVIGSLLAGCASYSARELPAPSSWGSAAERVGVTVRVDAYSDYDRQSLYFGEDLASGGALPLHILIENKGEVPRLVDPWKVRLRVADGNAVHPSFSDLVAALLYKPLGREADYAGAAFGVIGAIGALAAMQSRQDAQTARAEDYARKTLKQTVLKPGESSHGVVFFVLDPATPRFSKAIVVVTLSDPEGRNAENIEVAVKDIQFPSFSARDLARD